MSVSRRTVLRGIGATMALPWMESLPAWGSASTKGTVFPGRFAVLFMGNGINGNHWWAKGSGAAMTLSRSLAPLDPLKRKIIVVNGLFNKPALGMGIHPAQTGNLLSGAALGRGSNVSAGITVDQVIANHVGRETREAALSLACEPSIQGRHDTGFSLAYCSHIAWRSAHSPVPNMVDPAAAFGRLFAIAPRSNGQTVLDRVRDSGRTLVRSLSRRDQAALDEHFTGVRELEQRIDRWQATTGRSDDVRFPIHAGDGRGGDVREHARLMCDIIALAFQIDATRVATLVLASDLSAQAYRFLGVNQGHHDASHDDLSDGYERITRFHVGQLAYLAERLDGMSEGDGTVLDHCCLLWLSNMWAGWKHDNMKLPVVLAGGLNGTLETGRTLDYLYAGDENRRLCSLYLSIMDRMGIQLERFGDADRRLAGL